MKTRYALTKAATSGMLWYIRRRLEQDCLSPKQAIEKLKAIDMRYQVIWERYVARARVNPGCPDQKLAELRLQTLWVKHYGALPDKPLKCKDPHDMPAYSIWVDHSFTAVDQQSDTGKSSTDSPRIQTQRSEDEVLEEIASQGSERPRRFREGCNDRFIAEYAPSAIQLVNKVKRALQADSKSRVSRFRDSGSIDMSRLVDIAQKTDIQTVYKRIVRGKKLDACIQIYVDSSGSMSAEVRGESGSEVGCRRDFAVATSAILSTAFEYLKIPFQIISYDTKSSLIKGWRTKWKSSHLRNMYQGGWTDITKALCKHVPQMFQRKEQRKIAICITDGDLSIGSMLYAEQGLLSKWKRAGLEAYAIGLGMKVLCSDKSIPHVSWSKTVGCGNRVERYGTREEYENGTPPYDVTVGFTGGIDDVSGEDLLPKLSAHLVEIFTEGRQTIK